MKLPIASVRFVVGSVMSFALLQCAMPSMAEGYRSPPNIIARVIDAQPLPAVSPSPDGLWVVLTHQRDVPPIRALAKPSISLVRYEIDPETGARHADRTALGVGYTLIRVSDGRKWSLNAPTDGLSRPSWSPDSRRILFRHNGDRGVDLWVADVETKRARAVTGPVLNMLRATDVPCSWMADSSRAVCQLIPADRGAPPERPIRTIHPSIQETQRKTSRAEIWAGRLRNEFDAAVYDHYMTSQPVILDVETGAKEKVGSPGIYDFVSPSPDGRYLLFIRTVQPYSFLKTDDRFPKVVEILDTANKTVRTLAKIPLGNWGNRALGWAAPGPRWFSWMPAAPASLVYVEALDGGDPQASASCRDRLVVIEAPFFGTPRELICTKGRLPVVPSGMRYVRDQGNVAWLNNGLVWVEEIDLKTQHRRVWLLDTKNPNAKPRLLRNLSVQDSVFGNPLLVYGGGFDDVVGSEDPILRQDGDWVYLVGSGRSAQGARPFLDRFNIRTLQKQRVFQSADDAYERVLAVLSRSSHHEVLTRFETAQDTPNYYLRSLNGQRRIALTQTPHPAPQLRDVQPQLIRYERNDGVHLSGELLLPVDYRSGQKVPTVIWAYPEKYINRDAAEQKAFPINRFIWTQGHGFARAVRMLVTQGYAVFWYAGMPVIGGSHANDTAVQQLVANAQAAVDKLVDMGVADRRYIAIAGHSYGALMTATLLANSNLFAAGIAIEGAYNLTNTPTGIQDEGRTFWEAPNAYWQLSALLHADKISAPLLLIHGEVDDSYATTPGEAQRMYQALDGLGKKARLVMLPYEDHAPKARESTLHIAWEMLTWLNRYLKEDP